MSFPYVLFFIVRQVFALLVKISRLPSKMILYFLLEIVKCHFFVTPASL